jgi:2-keto-4-pentenoate hydratase/2-oxohepta-3-ene-1,7-dioic acid hydratase in catechol pathway
MKLVTFEYNEQQYVGAVKEDKVVNLNKVLDLENLTMLDLVERGLEYVHKVGGKLDEVGVNRDGETVFDLNEITIKTPLSNPGKVVCAGNNYMDHCREQNVEPPKKPLIFSKWSSCVIGPDEKVILPAESGQVDYEAELGVIIGKDGKHISADDVYDHIFGYVIVNDISARDVQFSDGQWVRGKSYDTFAPCGPYLVTADEIEDPQNLSIRLKVNGEVLQDSNTKEMIFDIKEQISYLSKGFTFSTGDLLATGTPHGVGVFRDPQIFLEDGDEMIIEIEGLGTLRNSCVREKVGSLANTK